MRNRVILAGYSGHALVVAEALIHSGYKIYGYLDHKININNYLDLLYLGSEKDNNILFKYKDYCIFPSVGNNVLREKIYILLNNFNITIPNAINETANISKQANINNGVLICRGANINPFAKIGNGAIINTGSIIEHECFIGDFAHIGPGAVLAGAVTIGKRSFIGANAVIKQGITIGDDVIIGAGTVVLADVNSNKVIIGNPGKELIK
jgi:sugar O-acyltransferase (sialic acid O-acetyltransferase NeuD family)